MTMSNDVFAYEFDTFEGDWNEWFHRMRKRWEDANPGFCFDDYFVEFKPIYIPNLIRKVDE